MSWSTSLENGFRTESVSQPDSGVESGSGGEFIDKTYWSESGSNGFRTETLGINASGGALAADGSALSGKAQIIINDSVSSSKAVKGPFRISSPPPPGVESGTDSTSPEVDFKFIPSSSGISKLDTDVGLSYDAGTFQYGEVTGKVTDYEGSPISGAAVFGEGQGTSTNPKGKYSIAAPGGTTVNLESLNRTVTDTITPNGGQSVTVNFQFSRLVIKVVDPELNPMVGTPVKINGDNYETNDDGIVTLDRAGIKTHNVVIDGDEEISPTIGSQGVLVEEQFGDSLSGYRVALSESETDLPIQGTTVGFKDVGVSSQTDNNGRASAIVDVEGEREVELGRSDRRYETKTVTVVVKNGEIKSEESALSRRSNVPTIS